MENLKPGKYVVELRDIMFPEVKRLFFIEISTEGISVSLHDTTGEIASVLSEMFDGKFRVAYWKADAENYFGNEPDIVELANMSKFPF